MQETENELEALESGPNPFGPAKTPKKPKIKFVGKTEHGTMDIPTSEQEGEALPIGVQSAGSYLDPQIKVAEVIDNVRRFREGGGVYNPVSFKDLSKAAWDSAYNESFMNFAGMGKDYISDKLDRSPELSYDEYKNNKDLYQPEMTEKRFQGLSRKTEKYLQRAGQEIEDERFNKAIMDRASTGQKIGQVALTLGYAFADPVTLGVSIMTGGLASVAKGVFIASKIFPRLLTNSGLARAAVGGAIGNLIVDTPFNYLAIYPRREEVLEKKTTLGEKVTDIFTSIGVGAGFGIFGHGLYVLNKKHNITGRLGDMFFSNYKGRKAPSVKLKQTDNVSSDMLVTAIQNDSRAEPAVNGDIDTLNGINKDVRGLKSFEVHENGDAKTTLPNLFMTEDGRPIQVDYKIVDVESLQFTNDSNIIGKKYSNPATVAEIEGSLRSNTPDEKGVSSIDRLIYSDNLEHGSPVISGKGQTISGNSRLKAIRNLYNSESGEGYRNTLLEKFPHMREDILAAERPVFIREAVNLEDARVFSLTEELDLRNTKAPDVDEIRGNSPIETYAKSEEYTGAPEDLNSFKKEFKVTGETNKKGKELAGAEEVAGDSLLKTLDKEGQAEHIKNEGDRKSALSRMKDFTNCLLGK